MYVEKEKKTNPKTDGAHASDSIGRYETKAVFSWWFAKMSFQISDLYTFLLYSEYNPYK